MLKGRVYPEKKNTIKKFKKSILKDMENDLDNYQAFRMGNTTDSEYILLKKNSTHYKILTNLLKVNDTVYIDDLDLSNDNSKVLKL